MKTLKTYNNFLNENKLIKENIEYKDFYIDDSMVEDYYEKNYNWTDYYDKDDVLQFFSWDNIRDAIDDERLTSDIKRDYITSESENIDGLEYQWYDFINSNIERYTDEINQKFKSEILDDLDDEEEKEDYSDYTINDKLNELKDYDESLLKDMIESMNDYSELAEFVWDERDESGYDYLIEIYGEPRTLEEYRRKNFYNAWEKYEEQIQPLFNSIKDYIDFDKLNKIYKENEDYEYKLEYFFNDIDDEKNQKRLIKYDKRNSIPLFDKIDDTNNYLKSYEFQNILIDEKLKYELDDEKHIHDEENLNLYLPDILLEIEDKIGLNNDIKRKYFKYAKKIIAKDFNL